MKMSAQLSILYNKVMMSGFLSDTLTSRENQCQFLRPYNRQVLVNTQKSQNVTLFYTK